MDEALVEHAEDQIDADQRSEDEQRHAGQQILERLGVALEGRRQTLGQLQLLHCALDRLRGRAERHPLREVEADGDRGELSLVADRQRRDRSRRPFRERAHGHHLIGGWRADVDLVECRGIAEELRQDLEDHIVSVHLGEILRHLPLAESVVERIVNELRLDAVA